jgi:hypothetical protein
VVSGSHSMAKIPFTEAQLELAQMALDRVDMAGDARLGVEACEILKRIVAFVRTFSDQSDDTRLELWREIEEAWPQLSGAMLSRLTEVLWKENERLPRPSPSVALPASFTAESDVEG